jgi:hypothetical protein
MMIQIYTHTKAGMVANTDSGTWVKKADVEQLLRDILQNSSATSEIHKKVKQAISGWEE